MVGDALRQRHERLMNVGAAFVASTKAPETVKPSEGALRHPPVDAQATAMLFVSTSQMRLYMTRAEFAPMGLTVVGPIAVDRTRPLARTSRLACHGGDRINQRHELGRIMPVGAGCLDIQRNTARVGRNVVLAPRLPTIGRVWAGVLAPTKGPNRCTRNRPASSSFSHPAEGTVVGSAKPRVLVGIEAPFAEAPSLWAAMELACQGRNVGLLKGCRLPLSLGTMPAAVVGRGHADLGKKGGTQSLHVAEAARLRHRVQRK